MGSFLGALCEARVWGGMFLEKGKIISQTGIISGSTEIGNNMICLLRELFHPNF